MIEENATQDEDLNAVILEQTKQKADLLGIKYHPNISAEKLSNKIQAHLEESGEEVSKELPEAVAEESQKERHARIRKEAARLVRIRLTPMNPTLKAHKGAVYSVSNSIIGTHRKYVAFDVPWHVPFCIYEHLKGRQCQVFQETKDERGRDVTKGRLVKEFAIEVLPNLTEKDLKDLAIKQASRLKAENESNSY